METSSDVTTRKTTWYYPIKWNLYILQPKQLYSAAVICKRFFTKTHSKQCILYRDPLYAHLRKQLFIRFKKNKNTKLISNLTLAKDLLPVDSSYYISAFEEDCCNMLK